MSNASDIREKLEQLSTDMAITHRFVHGTDTETVPLGTPPVATPSLRKMAKDIDARESAAARDAIATEGAKVIEKAKEEADRAAAEANKILALSVSAHESPNDAVAAEYTPETGMLHLFVPRGPKGEMGVAGPHGAQGPQGERGYEGVAGSQGAQGETGPQGMQGEAGPQGVQGEKGDTGPQGPRGEAPTVDVIHCGGAACTQVSVIDCGNASTFAPPPILH